MSQEFYIKEKPIIIAQGARKEQRRLIECNLVQDKKIIPTGDMNSAVVCLLKETDKDVELSLYAFGDITVAHTASATFGLIDVVLEKMSARDRTQYLSKIISIFDKHEQKGKEGSKEVASDARDSV